MIRKVEDFLKAYEFESVGTQKLLDVLTDESIKQRVADGHRTLGNIAWHIATTIPEMLGRTGLELKGPSHTTPTPPSARQIADAYREAAASLLAQIEEKWDDSTLSVEDDMYGEKWKRGQSLSALMMHECHHRGQLTVLMRQAGLRVPGIYGPAQEDWAQMGMQAPPE